MATIQHSADCPGRFVTYITNHITGEKIYARSFGKKAFFIPDSSDGKKANKPRKLGSSSYCEQSEIPCVSMEVEQRLPQEDNHVS